MKGHLLSFAARKQCQGSRGKPLSSQVLAPVLRSAVLAKGFSDGRKLITLTVQCSAFMSNFSSPRV